jgi:molecular chaperone DnaJ
MRLRGKGLPEFGGTRRGDFYLAIDVHIPERLSGEQRELYERLRSLNRPERATPRGGNHRPKPRSANPVK